MSPLWIFYIFLLFFTKSFLFANFLFTPTNIEPFHKNTFTLKHTLQRIKDEIQALNQELTELKTTKNPAHKKLQELIGRAASISETLNHLNQNYPELFIECHYLLPELAAKSFATRNLFESSNIITDLTEVGDLLETFQTKLTPLLEESDDASFKKIMLLVSIVSQTLLTAAVIAYIISGIYHQSNQPPKALASA